MHHPSGLQCWVIDTCPCIPPGLSHCSIHISSVWALWWMRLSLSCCLCSQLFSRCLTSCRGWNLINIVCMNYLLNPALVINNFTLPCSNLISHKAFTSWFTQGGGVGCFPCLTVWNIYRQLYSLIIWFSRTMNKAHKSEDFHKIWGNRGGF